MGPWRRTVAKESGEFSSSLAPGGGKMRDPGNEVGLKGGWKLVLVQRTEKLGEREHKALSPLQGKGHDDYDDDDFVTPLYTNTACMAI